MEVRLEDYDFHGWATKNDLRCSDGRVIRKDAFKHCDGQTVPLVWNHDHNDPYRIVGNVLLENRDEGVYGYAKFNDTELAKTARIYVEHGDITSLSIYANQLKQQGPNVIHGCIREVSLVLAGANPGASIQAVIKHDEESEEEAVIFTGEEFELAHGTNMGESAEENTVEQENEEVIEQKNDETAEQEVEQENDEAIEHADSDKTVADVWNSMTEEQQTAAYYIISQLLDEVDNEDKDGKENKDNEVEHAASDDDETVEDVWNTLSEKQKNAAYYIIAKIMEENSNKTDESEGGDTNMKHNVFENEEVKENGVLSHADRSAIIELAKDSTVGSLKKAMEIYVASNKDTLAHGIDAIDQLFPDYKDVHPGAPELIERDQKWVQLVLKKAHKSPVSRVRTRQADARANELRAKGYNNREEQKELSGNLKLLMRTFDPQTVYRRDQLHRDDIVDIDWDVVAYQKTVMKHNMEEEIALAALVGDGREDTDADKIHEDHIRSVWHDDELYTIHTDVDIEAAKAELQGSETGAHFGDNYVYAEAVVTAALYSREKYKGKGQLDFFCTPHLLNVMLLARDLNGRRIYDTKEDLAKALNVGEIHEVEQFEGLTRTTDDGDVKKLLGLFVNMANYQFGCTKGGELTTFEDFDIKFNKYEYLMETRLSGALTEIYSAIALEEPVSGDTGL